MMSRLNRMPQASVGVWGSRPPAAVSRLIVHLGRHAPVDNRRFSHGR